MDELCFIWINKKKNICKTQIRVLPQIRVQSLRRTQIHVLSKPCPLKSVSFDVTPRAMSFQKHIYLLRSVSSDTQNFFSGPLTVCDMHSMVHSFIFIQANIKHIHLSKKHHKNITLNKINRFKNSAWLPWITHAAHPKFSWLPSLDFLLLL